MGFVKLVKNKAYFKRYQVSLRRRREGKTDYKARRALTKQNKNKYNAPKYRLVVRMTNRYCICQIVYATIQGDKVMCAATSAELPRYGIKVGLSNFAAAYATGLLVARRLLNKLGLEEDFQGVEEVDGDEFHIEDEGEDDDARRPFKAILDVGLARTTVGAKVFAAMKGAADGGIHVPHSMKRFPGFKAAEEKGAEDEFNADALRDRIFGVHVVDYMESMEEEDPQKYQSHFAKYIENDISAGDIEEMYTEAHKKIRENPAHQPVDKAHYKPTRDGDKIIGKKTSFIRNVKLTKDQRKARVAARIERALLATQE